MTSSLESAEQVEQSSELPVKPEHEPGLAERSRARAAAHEERRVKTLDERLAELTDDKLVEPTETERKNGWQPRSLTGYLMAMDVDIEREIDEREAAVEAGRGVSVIAASARVNVDMFALSDSPSAAFLSFRYRTSDPLSAVLRPDYFRPALESGLAQWGEIHAVVAADNPETATFAHLVCVNDPSGKGDPLRVRAVSVDAPEKTKGKR